MPCSYTLVGEQKMILTDSCQEPDRQTRKRRGGGGGGGGTKKNNMGASTKEAVIKPKINPVQTGMCPTILSTLRFENVKVKLNRRSTAGLTDRNGTQNGHTAAFHMISGPIY